MASHEIRQRFPTPGRISLSLSPSPVAAAGPPGGSPSLSPSPVPVPVAVSVVFHSYRIATTEVVLDAQSFERQREVHRHIGDFTLFMAGLFPEYLRRLKTAGLIYHKDFLVDYMKTGKRSYGIVAEFGEHGAEVDPPLFRKLSDSLELFVAGLGFVRSDLDRMSDPAYQRVKGLLLN